MSGLDTDLWRSAAEIFDVAVILEGADRDAFVSRSCHGDGRLETAVRELLLADRESTSSFEPVGVRRMLELMTKLSAGQPVGPWHILQELGAGGMGTVYLAERRDDEFAHRVAIKVLALGVEAERFRQERQVLANLAHPNIAALLDGGTLPDDRPYVVMEYVEGEPLDRWRAAERPSLTQVLRLFCKLCGAVAHAHGKLVVHRDLKPANVLVRADDEPKLLDFGIAKILSEAEGEPRIQLTGAQVRVMTPGYASPEQIEGDPVSTATDIYSLGVLLYELICGERPFRDHEHTRIAFERAVLTDPIQPPGRRRPLPATLASIGRGRRIDLDSIVLRMLARDPEQRYRTVAEVMDDIESFLENRPVRARRATRFYAFRKLIARNRLASAAIGGLTTIATVFLVISVVVSHRLRIERDAAEVARQQAEFTTKVLTDAFRVADPVLANKPVSLDEVLDRAYEGLISTSHVAGNASAEIASVLGHVYVGLAKYDRARELLVRALDSYRAFGDMSSTGVGRLASSLAYLSIQTDRLDAARTYNELALDSEYAESGGIEVHLALESQRAHVLAGLGDINAAIISAEATLEKATDNGSTSLRYRTYRLQKALSRFYAAVGDEKMELERLEAAIATARSLEVSGADELSSLRVLAKLRLKSGDSEGAAEALDSALGLAEQLHHSEHPSVARIHREIGNLHFSNAEFDAALDSYKLAHSIFESSLGRGSEAAIQVEYNMSLALKRTGQLDEAEAYLISAIDGYERWEDVRRTELPYFYWSLGLLRQQLGRVAQAEKAYLRSIELNRLLEPNLDQKEELGQALVSLGLLYSDAGDDLPAIASLEEGIRILEQLGTEVQMRSRARSALDQLMARTAGREK